MNQSIKIADSKTQVKLNYQQALNFHKGDSIWGVAVAFRMLQLAERYFSKSSLWNRDDLFIVSEHPGPGVKDTIEFVTHCITNNQFQLGQSCEAKGCSRNMKFEWSLTHGLDACSIKLHDDFVPEDFYELLDRLNTVQEMKTDKESFKQFKQDLSEKIWQKAPEDTFHIEIISNVVKENKHAHA